MKHSREEWWLPLLESESEKDSESPVISSWSDYVIYSAAPTNTSFIGDGRKRCAMRWPVAHAALRRTKGYAAIIL